MKSIYHMINEKMFTASDMIKFRHFPGTLEEYVEAEMLWRDEIMPVVILNACAVVTNVKYVDVLTNSRKREAVFARYLAMHFLKALQPALSLREVGEYIGGKDHATVLHAYKTVKEVIEQEYNDQFKNWYWKAKRKVFSIYSNDDPQAIKKAKEENKQFIADKEEVAARKRK